MLYTQRGKDSWQNLFFYLSFTVQLETLNENICLFRAMPLLYSPIALLRKPYSESYENFTFYFSGVSKAAIDKRLVEQLF